MRVAGAGFRVNQMRCVCLMRDPSHVSQEVAAAALSSSLQ